MSHTNERISFLWDKYDINESIWDENSCKIIMCALKMKNKSSYVGSHALSALKWTPFQVLNNLSSILIATKYIIYMIKLV